VHRPWQEVDVQEGGLTPILCGCLSLGPPSDLHIATLLQAFGAWEMVPALGTIRMTTWLTLTDSTHSVIARLLNVHRLTVRTSISNSRFILKILYDLCRQALAERIACPRSRV
jgi:hypothetical protein